MPDHGELQQSSSLETSEFARDVAAKKKEDEEFDGCLGYERLV